ncbi:MAG: M48 family metallopeptidase, partial [Candidatus Omnitrophica bacterium]|nr:M48 family metallopeptidase [Candidatus Omnitrophota bacterium]
LRFLPDNLVEYVICHELSHLRFPGHGRSFRELIKKYFPQQRELHRQMAIYQFLWESTGKFRENLKRGQRDEATREKKVFSDQGKVTGGSSQGFCF